MVKKGIVTNGFEYSILGIDLFIAWIIKCIFKKK